MPRARNPQLEVDPQPSTSPRDRGIARAVEARRVGIVEIRDLIEGLDPVRDAPRLAAAHHALERLETAEREDTPC